MSVDASNDESDGEMDIDQSNDRKKKNKKKAKPAGARQLKFEAEVSRLRFL